MTEFNGTHGNPPEKGGQGHHFPNQDTPQGEEQERGRAGMRLWWLGFVSAVLLWAGGLLILAQSVYSKMPQRLQIVPGETRVDVLVCLIGGKGRIKRAFELFDQGVAEHLYLSGASGDLDPSQRMAWIQKELQWTGPVDNSRMTVENRSTNTIENALELARFLRSKGYKRILLLTSPYHIRRAAHILRRVLPQDVAIEVTWVDRDPFDSEDWWKSWQGIQVTTAEFFKFFWSWARLSLMGY